MQYYAVKMSSCWGRAHERQNTQGKNECEFARTSKATGVTQRENEVP